MKSTKVNGFIKIYYALEIIITIYIDDEKRNDYIIEMYICKNNQIRKNYLWNKK